METSSSDFQIKAVQAPGPALPPRAPRQQDWTPAQAKDQSLLLEESMQRVHITAPKVMQSAFLTAAHRPAEASGKPPAGPSKASALSPLQSVQQAQVPLSPWSQARTNSLPTRRTRPAAVAHKPDGILMLLEACEALDIHPRLLSHRSARQMLVDQHTLDAAQASSSTLMDGSPHDTCRGKPARSQLAMDRTCSEPLPPRRASKAQQSSDMEKENMGSQPRPPLMKRASSSLAAKPPRMRRTRSELHGPCCHCGASDSPQWRKGPKCKPILCNACGTRFLRTRSLGKTMGKTRRSRSGSLDDESLPDYDEAMMQDDMVPVAATPAPGQRQTDPSPHEAAHPLQEAAMTPVTPAPSTPVPEQAA